MSGFVVLHHADGRPVERSRMSALVGPIAYRGRDGVGSWECEHVGMAHALLTIGPASAERQPIVRDSCAVVFAGRLDNRAELSAKLPRAGADVDGDASLVLAAYLTWGEDAATRLLGDFAYAIWDGPRRRLVCARDQTGQKPLFYHAAHDFVVVASEPAAILADARVPLEIDEGVVAEHLAGAPRSREATLYAAVRRLLPAHLLIVDAAGCRTRRYWDFDRAREIRYRRETDYAEELLELCSRAVTCRVEDSSHTGVLLSGGLDSSFVCGLAAPAAAVRGALLLALSVRFPGRPCDEGMYVDAVARHTTIDVRQLVAQPAPPQSYRQNARESWGLPIYPNGAMFDPLRTLARQAHARVVLTGYGGDDWFTGSPAHTTDLLRAGRLFAAWRQLRTDTRIPDSGYTILGLARKATAPLLSPGVRAAARRLLPPPSFEWITPGLQRRVALRDRLRPQRLVGFQSAAQEDVYAAATSAATMIGDEMEERAAAVAGIEQRHPLNDRRVAAFALALPEHQRWSGSDTKIALRRAMRLHGGVPEAVLNRVDKAEFSSVFVDALESFGGAAAFENLRSEGRGWVNGDAVRAMYPRMMSLYSCNDAAYIQFSDRLWSILGLELWLEGLEAHDGRQAAVDG